MIRDGRPRGRTSGVPVSRGMNEPAGSRSRTFDRTRAIQRERNGIFMTRLSFAVAVATLFYCGPGAAQTNAGAQQADPNVPFKMTQVATFELPWRIAFLPDGRMLVTEKVGRVQ